MSIYPQAAKALAYAALNALFAFNVRKTIFRIAVQTAVEI